MRMRRSTPGRSSWTNARGAIIPTSAQHYHIAPRAIGQEQPMLATVPTADRLRLLAPAVSSPLAAVLLASSPRITAAGGFWRAG